MSPPVGDESFDVTAQGAKITVLFAQAVQAAHLLTIHGRNVGRLGDLVDVVADGPEFPDDAEDLFVGLRRHVLAFDVRADRGIHRGGSRAWPLVEKPRRDLIICGSEGEVPARHRELPKPSHPAHDATQTGFGRGAEGQGDLSDDLGEHTVDQEHGDPCHQDA